MSYGTDIYCYDSLQTGRLVSGVELVAQAIYRRLTTARGTLRGGPEEAVYGLDILDFVGHVGDAAVVALPDVVVAEVLKDDRVATAEAFAAGSTNSEGLTTILLDIDATLADEGEAFRLSLSISDVTVELLGITQP